MKGLLTLGVGLALTVVGVVAMKKASKKATELLEEHVNTKEIIESCVSEDYSEEDRVKDHMINNTQTVIKLFENYLKPGLASIGGGCFIIKGISILNKECTN